MSNQQNKIHIFHTRNPTHPHVAKPENLKELLGKGLGRNMADMIVEAIEQKPSFFEELMEIYLADEEPYSRKAAWAIDLYTEKDPSRTAPFVEQMVAGLTRFTHDGMKRHTLRILLSLPLPAEGLGTLVTLCFDWLANPPESAAVKVYSMELLYRISAIEPDLKPELADTISWRMEEESAGFRNRALKIMKKLSREIG